MKSLLILGRQPEIGIAELESLCGAQPITVIGRGGVLVDTEPSDIPFHRLGGSVKLARVIATLDSIQFSDIEAYLSEHIQTIISALPDGKIRLGISAYGLRVRATDINAAGLRLKKAIKHTGRSVRIVPNKYPELNSAQVLHNQLTGPTGCEIVIARYDSKTVIAQTVSEQDIEAYASRDQERPMRDAKVGMLPPKLAQILINLTNPNPGQMILDPFCGTGVVLQEALLMGFNAYGTDIDKRMVEYSKQNLQWLQKTHNTSTFHKVELGDATSFRWTEAFDRVAGETYLGKPLSSLPPKPVLDPIMRECDDIHTKFLKNIATQTKHGARLCLAVPAWKTKTGFLHLKTLDRLEELGYNRMSFVHVGNQALIYHRPGQTVARELVVLEKK